MSIQRYNVNRIDLAYPSPHGTYVAYSDHVAAVEAARAERISEWDRGSGSFQRGVKAAREAVAALPKHNMNIGSYISAPPLLVINRKQALAAIDGIKP